MYLIKFATNWCIPFIIRYITLRVDNYWISWYLELER